MAPGNADHDHFGTPGKQDSTQHRVGSPARFQGRTGNLPGGHGQHDGRLGRNLRAVGRLSQGAIGSEVMSQSEPSNREISATRVLDAPRELVWKVWTQPEH